MLNVDLDDPVPLYLQVSRGLKRAIASGVVEVGQRLPSVRQLAGDLAINLNTVARAYRQLEDDGLLQIRQGRGVRVASDQVEGGDPVKAATALRRALVDAFVNARLAGLGRTQIEAELERTLDEFAPDPGAPSRGGR